ncbi:MAG: nucleotidyltransferase domain-containing protein [Lachnospiraceae bacterium]|nr:nucleotidyltransferase domain-containing protein [Lachnospiraceae bacterium]
MRYIFSSFGCRSPLRRPHYGSVARGTQTPGSDIDIAVIVRSHTKEMHGRLHKRSVHLPL